MTNKKLNELPKIIIRNFWLMSFFCHNTIDFGFYCQARYNSATCLAENQ